MDGMKFPNKFVENIYKANKVLGKVESVLIHRFAVGADCRVHDLYFLPLYFPLFYALADELPGICCQSWLGSAGPTPLLWVITWKSTSSAPC